MVPSRLGGGSLGIGLLFRQIESFRGPAEAPVMRPGLEGGAAKMGEGQVVGSGLTRTTRPCSKRTAQGKGTTQVTGPVQT